MFASVMDDLPWSWIIESLFQFIYIKTCIFYQGFLSRTLTTQGTAGEARGPSFYSTPLTNIQTFILQFCTWDDYHIFLIAPLVFTRGSNSMRLPLYRITIWQIDDAMLIFVCLIVDLILGFCYSYLILETSDLTLKSLHWLSSLYYKRTD